MYVTEENNFIPYNPSSMNQYELNYRNYPYSRPRPRPYYPLNLFPRPFIPGILPPYYWYGQFNRPRPRPRPDWGRQNFPYGQNYDYRPF